MKLHGLRGSELEDMINKTIEDYRLNKLALIQKIPTPITPLKQDNMGRIKDAYFQKKSTVDYIGLVQEIPVAFDAKESKTDRFPLKNIHEHQYNFMCEWEEQGGASFLLILFRQYFKCYYMRFSELKKYWKNNKSFSIDCLDEKYFIDVKNKIRVDFLQKLQLDIDDR